MKLVVVKQHVKVQVQAGRPSVSTAERQSRTNTVGGKHGWDGAVSLPEGRFTLLVTLQDRKCVHVWSQHEPILHALASFIL